MAGQQFFDVLAMATKGTKGPTNATRIAADQNGVLYQSIKGGPFGVLGGAASSELALLARSAGIMGTSEWAANFDDLDDQTTARWSAVGGAITGDATHGFGVWQFVNTNTTILFKSGPFIVVNPRVTPWHIGGRMKLITAPGAGEIKCVSLDNNTANGSMRVGLNGPVSTTKFVFAVTDQAGVLVTALSTVNLDITNFHKVEMWLQNDVSLTGIVTPTVYGSVDNETPVFVCPGTGCPNNACGERTGVILAAGAAAGLFVDYIYAAAARTAT